MGDLKVETDALLRDNNFGPDDFSDAVLKNIGFDEWSVANESEEALASRRDFRTETTFTIDPNGTQELDDAIHVKELGDGAVEVGIHVADAAHFIKHNSLVDREAKKRGTAVYLMNREVNMLPPRLASDICSLSPGEDRFTVSVVFKVDLENGRVYEDDVWIGKAMIKSAGKLTYDEVDAVVKGDGKVELQGATAKDIHTLKVCFLHACKQILPLTMSRQSHRSSAKLAMDLTREKCLNCVSFNNLMMKMCPWSITFSIRHQHMRLLKNSATRQTPLWLNELLQLSLKRLSFVVRHHLTPEGWPHLQIG